MMQKKRKVAGNLEYLEIQDKFRTVVSEISSFVGNHLVSHSYKGNIQKFMKLGHLIVLHLSGSLSLLIKQDPYQLHCDICNIVFDCRTTFKEHVNNHEKESRQCDICNKVFKKVSSLKLHRLTHVRPFKCDQCDSAFGRKSNLIAHER